jgi:hypothetical protein
LFRSPSTFIVHGHVDVDVDEPPWVDGLLNKAYGFALLWRLCRRLSLACLPAVLGEGVAGGKIVVTRRTQADLG